MNGDPIINFDTSTSDTLTKLKKRAEYEFNAGNHNEAYLEYMKCLKIFGLNLPSSRLESFTMTTWQFVRMCLHRIWIGRWLSRKAGGLFCTDLQRKKALTSSMELSLIMHRLNQLHLTSDVGDSNGLMLSLFAVNMAEASMNIMSTEDTVDIYLTAALRVKRTYPKYLQFFNR